MPGGSRARLLLLLPVLLGGGCTAYERVDVERERLHEELRAGNAAQPGDWVEITLIDGSVHRFQVAAVDEDAVRGDGVEVAIDDIAALAARDFSPGRTAALVGGISVAWLALLAIALSSVTFMM